jgi:hypothetical protein
MNLTDELRKLADLHKDGQLTDQEFAEGKRRLLGQAGVESSPISRKDGGTKVQFEEKAFKSSRWSSGNLFFPDRLTMAPDGMVFRKGAMFGSSEEHISYHAVASFKVKNGIFLSDVCIETSGGSQPIFVNGLWKSDAREIQDLLRVCQKTD